MGAKTGALADYRSSDFDASFDAALGETHPKFTKPKAGAPQNRQTDTAGTLSVPQFLSNLSDSNDYSVRTLISRNACF